MTFLSVVRAVGFVEAISAIVLFFVAMPVKYLAGKPTMVTISGTLHGLLWVLYGIVVLVAWWRGRLPGVWVWILGAASLIPFGPFLADGRLKRFEQAQSAKRIEVK